MQFVHGTSSAHLASIQEHGLLPTTETSNSTEKRIERLDRVHVLDQKYAKYAGAYALRAVQHWGGEPILVIGDLPNTATVLAIPGNGRFPDIYTAPYIPPAHIEAVIPFTEESDISDLFKAHKS